MSYGSGQFETSLFGCFEDLPSCLLTCYCPILQASFNQAKANDRDWTICDCLCGPSEWNTRQRIRIRKGYAQDEFADCLVLCCCGACAICQDARALKD